MPSFVKKLVIRGLQLLKFPFGRFAVNFLFCIFFGVGAIAQGDGQLELIGSIKKNGQPVVGAEIKFFTAEGDLKLRTSDAAGNFKAKLGLDKEYIISAQIQGTLAKQVNINTEVPNESKKGAYTYRLDIDLTPPKVDPKGKKVFEESVGLLKFNPASGGFVVVANPIKKSRAELEKEQLAREAAARSAKFRAEQQRLAQEELERQKRVAAMLEKKKNDSLLALTANSQQYARSEGERKKLEEAAETQKKAELEKKALREASTREKNAKDSLAKVSAEQKVKELAEMKENARLKKENEQREKAEALAKQATDKERLKADAARSKQLTDSTAKAQRDAESKLAAEAKEIDKQKKILEETERKAAEAKAAAERKAAEDLKKKAADEEQNRIKAEIAQQKDVAKRKELEAELAKKAQIEKERQEAAAAKEAEVKARERTKFVADSTYKAKIEADKKAEQDKIAAQKAEQDKIKAQNAEKERKELEEKLAAEKRKQQEVERKKQEELVILKEKRRTNSLDISIQKEGNKSTLLNNFKVDGNNFKLKKITYSYGATFFFLNDADISENLYESELKRLKEEVNPENISEK